MLTVVDYCYPRAVAGGWLGRIPAPCRRGGSNAMDLLTDLDKINSYSSIPLQVVGFSIAYWQIRKAKSAAESAREAISSTESAIAKNRILTLVPHLRRIEQALASAIEKDSAELVIIQLDEYRFNAAELRGTLDSLGVANPELLTSIQDSFGQLSVAIRAIRKNPTDLSRKTATVRESIMKVTTNITEKASNLLGEG